MLLVRDIMTKSVLTLAKDTPLSDAATTLSNMGVSGAPVCDEGGRVIGVFSKSDIVNKLADGTPASELTVGSLMTNHVFSVRAGDPLKTAVWLMVFENVHRLMVIGDDGRLAGILTPMDVLKAIVNGKLATTSLEDR
ncbi:MAG: CBS domain-containing protein [Polyangiaceae bacterium]|nr:CBS domain-containing protein [Polyangiaceae bacterium]